MLNQLLYYPKSELQYLIEKSALETKTVTLFKLVRLLRFFFLHFRCRVSNDSSESGRFLQLIHSEKLANKGFKAEDMLPSEAAWLAQTRYRVFK